MAVGGNGFVMYGQNNFQRDASLDAWKRRWMVLRKRYVGISMDVLLTNMLSIRCEQDAPYCCRLLVASDAKMEVGDGDTQLQWLIIGRPYTSDYLPNGGLHRMRTLEFNV